MFLVVYSSACAIFITKLSLVAELSPVELVNFTKSLLSRALLIHFCKYCSEIYTMFVCIMKLCICYFHDHTIIGRGETTQQRAYCNTADPYCNTYCNMLYMTFCISDHF